LSDLKARPTGKPGFTRSTAASPTCWRSGLVGPANLHGCRAR
jgi:hypothetical protein